MLSLLDVKCLVLLIQLNQNQVPFVVISPLLLDGKNSSYALKSLNLGNLVFLVTLFTVQILKRPLNVKLIYGSVLKNSPTGHTPPNDGSMNEYNDIKVEQTTI